MSSPGSAEMLSAKGRRVASFLRPAFLFSVPLWLPSVPLAGTGYRSVTGVTSVAGFSQSVYATWLGRIVGGYQFRRDFLLALGAVVALQVFLTLARLGSLDEATVGLRARIGRALVFAFTLLAMTYGLAGKAWSILGQQREQPLEGTVYCVMLGLVLAFLALETSRRGPWSGTVALCSGTFLAFDALPRLRKVLERGDVALGPALAFVALLAIGAYVLAVIVLRALHGREHVSADPRDHLRAIDAGYLPFASVVAVDVFAAALDLGAPETANGYSCLHALVLAAVLVVTRARDLEPRALARAGLGVVQRREEALLVPLAAGALAWWFVQLRLHEAARAKDDFFLSATAAEQIAASHVPYTVYLAIILATTIALGPWVRWVGKQPATAEESPSPAGDAPSAPAG